MRREALQYRQLHRKALSAGLESGDAANLWPDDISGIVATTFVESTNDREESRSDLASRPDHKSVFSSATSFMSSYNNLGESDLCIPDLSDMILDGVALQYGELFECPYCRTVQNAANQIEWRYVNPRHLEARSILIPHYLESTYSLTCSLTFAPSSTVYPSLSNHVTSGFNTSWTIIDAKDYALSATVLQQLILAR